MKKRLISLAMAMVLCLGLTVPALADDPSVTMEDALDDIAITYDIGSGDLSTTEILQPITTGESYEDEPVEKEEYKGFYYARKNTVFTVKNVDTDDDKTLIQIYVKPFYKESDSYYETDNPYDNYLTNGDGFYENYIDPDVEPANGLVELAAGESKQFSFPVFESEEDVIWRVSLHVLYPPYEYEYCTSSLFLLDDHAVDTILAGGDPSQPTAPASGFEDVPDGAYYTEAVTWAVDNEIAQGDGQGHFFPDQDCTAEQILTFIWRAYGSPDSTATCPFQGVKDTSPYYKALCWAGEKGIVDDTGSSSAPCTREMAVTYLWKAAGSPEPTISATFSDVPDSCAKAVSWAVENEITQGTGGGLFSPDVVCSRGQIATFLYRDLA